MPAAGPVSAAWYSVRSRRRPRSSCYRARQRPRLNSNRHRRVAGRTSRALANPETMYAVIETGGKQYRVELGNEIEVERLDAEPGETIKFDRVLLVADGDTARSARPLVDDALVTARRPAPGSRRQDHRLQVPAQGAPSRQEGPPPGPDGPAHRRHRVRRPQRRRRGGCRRRRTSSRSARQAEAEAEKKATADQALAAKLAADAARPRRPRRPSPRPRPQAQGSRKPRPRLQPRAADARRRPKATAEKPQPRQNRQCGAGEDHKVDRQGRRASRAAAD